MTFDNPPSSNGRGVQKEEDQVEVVQVEVDPKDIPDVSKYEELSTTYEGLKWRIISRPGGATMKPLNFYRMGGRDPHCIASSRPHTSAFTSRPPPLPFPSRRARQRGEA